ncbi:DUF308 domain-containing protein [Kocuria palustris]|uniref:DUF308 domain-containing protein n=1 Tax=Kocuria palustris TaxID=71999 RepID=UPI0011AAAC10|nr:DUF308 domain-containing protein [Kocuria palustris]
MSHDPAALRSLVAPTLVRALVTLAFAAGTIFVTAPGLGLSIWLLGLWMAAVGVCVLWTDLRAREHPSLDLGTLASVPRSTGVMWILGGIAVVMIPETAAVLALVASVVLFLAGLPEGWVGTSRRSQHPLARDWQIAGLVTAAAAIGVLLVAGLGPHAILGVVGGAAIISGVLLLLGALSLRHDAREGAREADPSSGPADETAPHRSE